MKKIVIIVLLLTGSSALFSQELSDRQNSKLKAECTFSINTNGISSVPSFSLGAPAIMAAPVFTKGRFSYEPLLAYDMDIQPWFIDNWFRYKIVDRPAFELRTGLNFSMYFSDYKLPDETILQGQRYWAAELAAIYKPSDRSYLSATYWNDNGQDPGSIKGHYISLVGERSKIALGKSILLAANLNFFYINYDGNNDGLFISPKITSSVRNLPFALFFHGIQAITSNISPYPGFSWNLGFSYTI